MSDANATQSGEKTVVVTEEDLMKSLRTIEGKLEAPAVAAPVPVLKTTELLKSMTEVVAGQGTENLKKSLDVSSALSDFADLMGLHVDTSLAALSKSIQSSGERDMVMISVMGEMKKSIDALAAKVEAYGAAPAGTPSTVRLANGSTQTATTVLEKGLKPQETGAQTAEQTRKQVTVGLEALMKSSAPGSQDAAHWMNSAVKFESTKEISDADLQRAIGAYKKLSSV